jgi:hypothetical protein
MAHDELASLIRTASPVLATELQGANAPLVLSSLGRTLADDDHATAAEIVDIIKAGAPDVALKIKAAEEKLLASLDAAGVTLAALAVQDSARRVDAYVQVEQAHAKDRENARERQIKSNDSTNFWLAIGITIGFFAILFCLLFAGEHYRRMPRDLRATLQTLLGVLGTGWISILTFYFGSSTGSKEKTALLEENVLSATRATPQNTQ